MVREAVEAGADIIMLDNMTHDDMAAAIELIAGRAKTGVFGQRGRRQYPRARRPAGLY